MTYHQDYLKNVVECLKSSRLPIAATNSQHYTAYSQWFAHYYQLTPENMIPSHRTKAAPPQQALSSAPRRCHSSENNKKHNGNTATLQLPGQSIAIELTRPPLTDKENVAKYNT